MSELPISSKYRSTPTVPVDDDERSRLSRQLNDAYTDGRLADDDYRERLDTLYGATTLGELVPVVTGLGPMSTHAEPSIVQQTGEPGEVGEGPTGHRFTAILGLVLIGAIGIGVVLLLLLLLL